jgi:hypothetical protein
MGLLQCSLSFVWQPGWAFYQQRFRSCWSSMAHNLSPCLVTEGVRMDTVHETCVLLLPAGPTGGVNPFNPFLAVAPPGSQPPPLNEGPMRMANDPLNELTEDLLGPPK